VATSTAVPATPPAPAPPGPPAAPVPVVGELIEVSGTLTGTALARTISSRAPGPVTVRPAPGASATVTGSFSPPRPGVHLDGLTFTDDVTFGPGADGGELANSRARQFNIFGADDVVIQGNVLDGLGQTANNQIWDEPARALPERFVIQGNIFTRYFTQNSATHSEALFVGYSANGLIAGNTFVDNGNTGHIFFTWFGAAADPASTWPRAICVRANAFGPRHNAFFDVNFRAEIPVSSGIAIDPGQGALSTSPAFTRHC
jgi:hypothetical protein